MLAKSMKKKVPNAKKCIAVIRPFTHISSAIGNRTTRYSRQVELRPPFV
jgi:hypothetical protein